jgi:hypothetical protein
MKTIITLLIFTSFASAQQAPPAPTSAGSSTEGGQVYEIPFPEGTGESKGNVIELSVANTSALTAEQVKVEVAGAPSWITFARKDTVISSLKSKEEQTASFTFSVGKAAEVNKEQTLSFAISTKNGEIWTKEIKVKVAPPATYELFQNYPNPFNPTTVISYQLSGISKVNLKVYDILGREIANLVNELQEPGYYQKTFNARSYASGMYVYQLIATDEQNHKHTLRKKMMLVK